MNYINGYELRLQEEGGKASEYCDKYKTRIAELEKENKQLVGDVQYEKDEREKLWEFCERQLNEQRRFFEYQLCHRTALADKLAGAIELYGKWDSYFSWDEVKAALKSYREGK